MPNRTQVARQVELQQIVKFKPRAKVADADAVAHPTEVVTVDGIPAEDSTTVTKDDSEISQLRSPPSDGSPGSIPFATASMSPATDTATAALLRLLKFLHPHILAQNLRRARIHI